MPWSISSVASPERPIASLVTAIPKSNDIVPVRNQILEIDLINTTTGGTVDAQATTGLGYTVTATGTTSTTTVSTPSSTPTTSAY